MAKISYGEKIALLGRHEYDRNSKSFQAGAWKNLSPDEAARNRRWLERN